MINRIFLIVSALMILFAAGVSAEVGVTDTEIVIGCSTPLTGPAALWGVTGHGMQAWADHINANGGIHGRKIKLLKDDGYHPAKAMANLQEMRDQVFAVAGLLGSAACSASKDFFPENKIPLITAYANVRIYANQPKEKHKWYFIAYPDYEDENHYLANYAINELKAKKSPSFTRMTITAMEPWPVSKQPSRKTRSQGRAGGRGAL
jgi:branched-chain amino acid transport system substrate-binding protein